jgi:hypothetical protein
MKQYASRAEIAERNMLAAEQPVSVSLPWRIASARAETGIAIAITEVIVAEPVLVRGACLGLKFQALRERLIRGSQGRIDT